MRVLVLGGRGFVGQHVVAELERLGHSVVSASRRDGLDLRDFAGVRALLRDCRPEAVFNLAAHVGSLHYVTEHAAVVFDDNVTMALNLYRGVAEEYRLAIVVNPLSNCSYPGDAVRQREPEWWDGEVHDSVYAYGNAKRFIYVTSRSYARQYGIESRNFLVPNSYGPGDYTDPNKTHALNGMIIRMLLAHRRGDAEFEIWGTGSPVREWVFVRDVARVLALSPGLERDLTYPLNIAQGCGYSIRQSAALIAATVGYQGRLVFNAAYADGAPIKILDAGEFNTVFPDFRFHDHGQGVRETVAYYEGVL